MSRAIRTLASVAAAAVIALPTAVSAAEEGTVKIMAPWESSGQIFQVGPDEVLFLGVAEGIMYIDEGEGVLDAAALQCPGTREISLEAGASKAHGRCVITGEGGDQIFAVYRCEGAEGDCEGTFELTGGTGRFEGITGKGAMQVRTRLMALAQNAETGAVVSGAAGLAKWPALSYKIP
jgi:hypothetical protein